MALSVIPQLAEMGKKSTHARTHTHTLWLLIIFIGLSAKFSSYSSQKDIYSLINALYVVHLWPPFCPQVCLNSSKHRFSEVLDTLLRGVGPFWHHTIAQLLQICCLDIHAANFPFHSIPEVPIRLRSGDKKSKLCIQRCSASYFGYNE